MFFDFLDRPARILCRRRSNSSPEDADKQVGVLENSLIDDGLRSVAHLRREVGFPANGQQHDSATNGVHRIPFVHHLPHDIPLGLYVAGRCDHHSVDGRVE